MEAVSKQQPDNTQALRRLLGEVKTHLASLEQSGKPVPAKTHGVQKGAIGPPSGPLPPGGAHSAPSDVERGRKATLGGTYLPGPRLKPPPKSLGSISSARLQTECLRAQAKVEELEKLLRASASSRQDLPKRVSELRRIIESLAAPSSNQGSATDDTQKPSGS
jgi:hypothetical protein